MDSKLIVMLLALLAAAAAQNFEYSSYGRYFRFMMLDNFVERPLKRSLDLYVCNKAGQGAADVQIGIPYWKHKNCNNVTLNIPGGECQQASLCDELRHTYADSNLAKKVIELTSTEDVAVQGFNVEKFSADSFAVFPWESSGLTHFVMTYVLQNIQTQFGIVTNERTSVRITVPDRADEIITIDYMGLRYHNGEVIEFTLDPEHTFLAQSSGDLTGTLIQTSKPVAVFTGNVRTFNDYNRGSRDHLIEQVSSTVKWGQEFVYVPTPRNNPGDFVRIMSRFANTRVEFVTDESNSRTLRRGGDFFHLELNSVTHIKANKQVLVAVTEVRMDFNAPVTYKDRNYDKLGLNMLKHEIFQAQSDIRGADLTGSKVEGDKRIAVFSGNVRTKVILSASRDHLATQIPPTDSWGTDFIIAAIHLRTVGDIIRVVASEPSTTVSFQSQDYNLPNAGSFVEIDLPTSSTGGQLTSNKKVLVVQIMKSQAAPRIEEAADPAMILVSPTDQYVTRSGLITPLYTQGTYKSGQDYNNWLTVIIRSGQQEGIRINGEQAGVTQGVFEVVSTRSIPGTSYVAHDIHLMLGGLNSYVITHASDRQFSGYMIGIADRESYGVGVGYNLPDVAA